MQVDLEPRFNLWNAMLVAFGVVACLSAVDLIAIGIGWLLLG